MFDILSLFWVKNLLKHLWTPLALYVLKEYVGYIVDKNFWVSRQLIDSSDSYEVTWPVYSLLIYPVVCPVDEESSTIDN